MSEAITLFLLFFAFILFALTLSGGLTIVLSLLDGPRGHNKLERNEGLRLLRRTMKDLYGREVYEHDESADRMSRDAWAAYRHIETLTDYDRFLGRR